MPHELKDVKKTACKNRLLLFQRNCYMSKKNVVLLLVCNRSQDKLKF